MIHVLATIELQPGVREEFLGHFHEVAKLVREEQGCLEYGPAVDLQTSIAAQPPERPDVVVVIEKWDSLDALEAHLIAPHMIRYREQVKSLVAGAVIQVLQPA
ncbi:MAG: antibiotic biosynthesis monooxygenase [Planctomycetales bacterium]|nr:antibiotic biosynthesis monooxygenase [Planctomycetales bacterium]